MTVADSDVLVIGGGPAGLATALRLGHAGVRTTVIDRDRGRGSAARRSRAVWIFPEVSRVLAECGVFEQIRPAVLPGAESAGPVWLTRMNRIEMGSDTPALSYGGGHRTQAPPAAVPTRPVVVPSAVVAASLWDAVAALPSVTVHRGAAAASLAQDSAGVVVRTAGTGPGEHRARYVVAADGAASSTRKHLGIGDVAERYYGRTTEIRFRADLDHIVAGRPHVNWWIVNADVQGLCARIDGDTQWLFRFEGGPADHYDTAQCVNLIRAAVGDPNLDVEVLSVLGTQHRQAVAEQWRAGRVLLAGEAAHEFSAHTAAGLNSAIEDAACLSDHLVEALGKQRGNDHTPLNAYAAERKAALLRDYCPTVAAHCSWHDEMGWLIADPRVSRVVETPDGRKARRAIGDAMRDRPLCFDDETGYGNTMTGTTA